MTDILQDPFPDALVRAIEENVRGFFRLFRTWQHADIYDGPDMLCALTDIPFSVFNSVVDAQLEPQLADAAIEVSIALRQARKVPMLWITGLSSRPDDLGDRLVAHGFLHERDEPEMAVDLAEMNEDTPTPAGLTIAPVYDSGTFARWSWVSNAGFGVTALAEPAWFDLFSRVGLGPDVPVRHCLGRLDGVPVATCSLLPAGGVAGIFAVATLPQARRKGIGTAMTLTALRDGREDGYRVGVFGASAMGQSIYGGIGFREVCTMGSYVWTPRDRRNKE